VTLLPLERNDPALKEDVRAFWNEGSCGEVYAVGESLRERLESHARARYALEPEIRDFARFADGAGKDVLEIGVGMGADHLEWARSGPRSLCGIDLTPRAIEWTRRRLQAFGCESDLRVGDAEQLPFADESFDIVYSWGVIHCTPNTARACQEIHRVLRPGGIARILVYHRYSFVGYMLWLRYGLMSGKPGLSLDEIYARHLESPGIKAYSVDEANQLVRHFASSKVWTCLNFGDLLNGEAGQRHRGPLLAIARRVWPRWLIRRFFPRHGLNLMIEAIK